VKKGGYFFTSLRLNVKVVNKGQRQGIFPQEMQDGYDNYQKCEKMPIEL
jgi:hypothetical protein